MTREDDNLVAEKILCMHKNLSTIGTGRCTTISDLQRLSPNTGINNDLYIRPLKLYSGFTDAHTLKWSYIPSHVIWDLNNRNVHFTFASILHMVLDLDLLDILSLFIRLFHLDLLDILSLFLFRCLLLIVNPQII